MKKKIIFIIIGIIISLICIWCFIPRYWYNDYRISEGNILVEKIETFREENNKLPESLNEIGVEEKMGGMNTLYYQKLNDLHYIIWFGTSLGESITYYSDDNQWKDK